MPHVADPQLSDAALDGIAVTPAPWTLTGRALVVLYPSTPARARRNTPAGPGTPLGGLSALVLVDYASSAVGPYGELIAIPGLVRLGGKIGPSISRIWVTSPASVVSGRANWAIPKNLAKVERRSDGPLEHWSVSDADGSLIELTHRPYGPRIPVLKPHRPGALLQHAAGRVFATGIAARGVARPTRITQLTSDRDRLLDPGHAKPLAFTIDRFTMDFRRATITPLAG